MKLACRNMRRCGTLANLIATGMPGARPAFYQEKIPMTPNAGAPRGLEGVVAAQTRMSHVDGQNGVLIIGGYSVEDLATHAGLEAAAHLLWRGRLPDRVELRELVTQMAGMRQLAPLTIEV